MNNPALDDIRATAPAERLLEDSWEQRSRRTTKRELRAEVAAGALFLVCAGTLALTSTDWGAFDAGLAALLVVLVRADVAHRVPDGRGVRRALVPGPGADAGVAAPGDGAAADRGGTAARRVRAMGAAARPAPTASCSRSPTRGTPSARPWCWYWRAPPAGSTSRSVYVVAFLAGCLVDLVSAISREAAALGIAPRVQMRVVALVWVVDACLAPVGLVVANAARHDTAQLAADPAAEPAADPARARPQRPDRAGAAPPRAGRSRAAPPTGRGQPPGRRIRRAARPGCTHRHRAERRGRGARRRWRSPDTGRTGPPPNPGDRRHIVHRSRARRRARDRASTARRRLGARSPDRVHHHVEARARRDRNRADRTRVPRGRGRVARRARGASAARGRRHRRAPGAARAGDDGPAHAARQPPPARRGPRRPAHEPVGERTARAPACSTSTASRTTTTRSGTPPATRC